MRFVKGEWVPGAKAVSNGSPTISRARSPPRGSQAASGCWSIASNGPRCRTPRQPPRRYSGATRRDVAIPTMCSRARFRQAQRAFSVIEIDNILSRMADHGGSNLGREDLDAWSGDYNVSHSRSVAYDRPRGLEKIGCGPRRREAKASTIRPRISQMPASGLRSGRSAVEKGISTASCRLVIDIAC
jgi:hypothetical protein